MTALERAEVVLKGIHREWDTDLRDAIHRAIIEHCNAEVERRRAAEKELNSLVEVISGNAALAAAVKNALILKAMEGGSKPDVRHEQGLQDSQEYAKALEGDR